MDYEPQQDIEKNASLIRAKFFENYRKQKKKFLLDRKIELRKYNQSIRSTTYGQFQNI